jgi:hypothetical protein
MERTLPTHLHVIAWPDSVIDRLGFAPQSVYTELAWTPILGPASVLAYRRIAGTLEHHPDGYRLDIVELAGSLGLGSGTGAHSTIARTLRRIAAFHLAVFTDDDTYAIRRRIPPLTGRQASRLSPSLARVVAGFEQRHWDDLTTTATTARTA